ncbi:MAG: hypothetical protein WC977_01840 [Anaerovoracaceae bacterium]
MSAWLKFGLTNTLAYNTVSKGVHKLIDLEILEPTKNVSRNRVFGYEEYLKILRKGT